MNDFAPYFDQEDPQVPVTGMIADLDDSHPWELDSAAVFKAAKGYLVVIVSGCSCWPDRGTTRQTVCPRKSDVDKALSGNWRELLDKRQSVSWKVTKK
jgi:hypothetical protein